MRSDLTDIDVHVTVETDAAVRVSDGTREVWLPKSQIEISNEGRRTIVTLPKWLAQEKGLL